MTRKVDLSGRSWSPTTTVVVWVLVVALELWMTLRFLREEFTDLLGPTGWFAGDGERTLHATRVWLEGGQPYDVFGFLYAPVALVFSAPFAALGDDLAEKIWLAIGVGLIVTCTFLATRGVAWWGRVLAITGVLIFHATVGDYLLANTTMVLVAGMFFVIRGESVRSGVLLGVLTAAFPKPMLIPFLLWALVWRPRPLAGVAIGGAAATVLGLVVAGIGLHLTFVDTLVHGGGITVRFAGNYGLSLVSPALAAVVAVFVMVALSVVLVRRGPIVGLVWALAGGILVSPYAPMYSGLPYVLGVPAVYAIAPSLAIGYVLTAVLAEQATPLSAVILLFAALLVPYRVDRRGTPPIWPYLERAIGRRREFGATLRSGPAGPSPAPPETPPHELSSSES
jgi:hypothetical protein